MAWLICDSKCADANFSIENRLFWSSELKTNIFCPVCEERHSPLGLVTLGAAERERIEEFIRKHVVPGNKRWMSNWFVCETGIHSEEPLENSLFWSSEGFDKTDPTCPRCGGCCPSELSDLSPEDQQQLGRYIKAEAFKHFHMGE